MKLGFRRMELENFASFIGEHKFSFTKLGPGVHYVRGKNKLHKRLGANGAGKSTLFNALTWCLTGKSIKGSLAPKLKPRFADGTTSVKVFLHVDEERRVIERTARPNLLTLDGEEVSQDHIDRLIRLPFPVFKQTVLFGQGQPLFLQLANKDKLSVLSEVLELERWEERSKKASERTAELNKLVSDLESDQIANKASRRQTREFIRVAEADYKEWRRANRDEIAKRLVSVAEAEKLLRTALRNMTAADDKAKRAAKALGEAEADVGNAKTALETFDRKEGSIKTSRAVTESHIERINKELADFKKAKVCPTCNQPIENKKGAASHREHLKEQREKYQEQLTDLKLDTKGRQKLLDTYTTSRSKLARLQADYDDAHKTAEKLHRAKVEADGVVSSNRQIIERLKAQENPYAEQIDKLKKQLAVLRKVKSETVEQLTEARDKRDRAQFWIKGFKDIRLLQIEELLGELEITVNSLLEDMGMTGWSMQFTVERETKSGTVQHGIEVMITTPEDKDPVSWDTWSGGEEQRLRLVGSMALSEVLLNHAGVEIDLEILDEPTRSMGDEGVEDLIDTLATRATDLQRCILYVDHMAVESSQFSNVITIIKDKEGSRIDA